MKKIILRATHEKELNGVVLAIDDIASKLIIPTICGCKIIFTSGGWTEQTLSNEEYEVWVQEDFEFNKYSYVCS